MPIPAQNNEPRKETPKQYQQRLAGIKNEIVTLCERNMDNTVRTIRRWLNDDMRIINQYVLDKYGKDIHYPNKEQNQNPK